ncbi:MAG: hypothetical protein WA811_14110 [Candidatus Sulfotelmatobacter sp.]
MNKISDNDPDRAKGAIEIEEHHHDGNLGLSEPLGHRDQDPLIKDADSDFPEPDGGRNTLGKVVGKQLSRKLKRKVSGH